MKIRTSHGPALLPLAAVLMTGCADDGTATTSGGTESSVADSYVSVSADSTGSDATGDTRPEAMEAWYGAWYAIRPDVEINAPVAWNDGGGAFGFTTFELRAGSATIRVERCLWETVEFEYRTSVGSDGFLALEPVGGVHEFEPHGALERLYVEPGADCASLAVKEIGEGGEVRELFSSSGGPLARGKLCLEACAEKEGEFGRISDCGAPVPWKCGE